METPPPSPPQSENPPEVTSKRTRQSTRLRSLTFRCLDGPWPVVNVNPATGRGSGPHKEIFHSYLGVVAREKVPIVHTNWNVVPDNLKSLIWKDILGIRKKAQEIQKFNDCPHLLSRGGYELLDKKLMEEKSKCGHEEHSCTESPTLNIDPPSPVARHMKWKITSTKRHGQMTYEVAQEIADKIDILNTTLGRPEHPGRVRVARTGITISQYFGQASHASSTSSPSINQQQLADIIGGIKDDIRKQLQDEIRKEVQDEIRKEVQQEHKQQQEAWMRAVEEKQWQILEMMKQELKKSLKVELSHIASHQSAPIEALEIQALLARVSTKVVGQNTVLAGLGKVFENSSTIYNVRYENDVVKVQVVRTYMPHAEVPIPTSEVHYLEQAVGTFVAWPTHLVREVTNEVVVGLDKPPSKSVGEPNRLTSVATNDPLGELVKKSYVVYTKPMELAWDGAKFGLPNATNGFFITHADVTEIILGDKCLNISVLQLWMIAMKKICSNLQGKDNAPPPPPQWIEAKSHVQQGAYECGYYVMHWMWCIVSGGLKNELHDYFSDGTALDTDTMTTLRKKWAAYFLEVGKWMSAFEMFLLGSFSPPQPFHTLVQEIIGKAPQRSNPERRRDKVYIGCGAGFGGDKPLAALKLLQRVQELNYLVLECLAERTLADRYQIMMSGGDGYDSQISNWMHMLLPLALERGTCIITNMGAIFLKLFPNMLPSTFQDKMKEQVRTGARVSNDEILGFAKLFNDELTLDNISRPLLVNMCKYMGINPYGTDAYLRYMLRKRLQEDYDGKVTPEEVVSVAMYLKDTLGKEGIHKLISNLSKDSGQFLCHFPPLSHTAAIDITNEMSLMCPLHAEVTMEAAKAAITGGISVLEIVVSTSGSTTAGEGASYNGPRETYPFNIGFSLRTAVETYPFYIGCSCTTDVEKPPFKDGHKTDVVIQ
ncbi:Mitochondrial proton/calcium exchanger protein [Glycine max]|nr:Mitochondrial proton/calcium exchanger protein [Glycine max]